MVRSIDFEDLTTVITQITTEHHILAVSDGSAKTKGMTYGWVLATTKGTRIATGNGPSDGRPSSMRSEGQGMLAVSLFLAMIQLYTNSTDTIKIEFKSDNQELINRQNLHKGYTIPYPNATLKAEYDLIEQIYQTHRDYNIKGSFSHVYGHQDIDTKLDKLPLDAQMNVEADALAEEYYSKTVQSSPETHLLPACPAMLVLNGITVSNTYKKHLIRACTEPHYIGYLQDKYDWSDSLIQSIAWKSLSCGINRVQRPCLVTKICNDLLPTATILQK